MSDAPDMNCLVFLGNDLMFQSRIGSVARSAGLKLIAIRDPSKLSEKLAETLQAQENIRYVVVDLGMQSLNLEQTAKTVLEAAPTTHLLGFGAHVLKETLEQAVSCGFHSVLTRGQFDRDMSHILT